MERIKLIVYAILIGFLGDVLVVLLQYINSGDLFCDFIISVLVLTVVANFLIYKTFIEKNKTAYALICIPSAYFGQFLCFSMWEMIFKDIIRYVPGAVLVWYYSMFTSICVCVVVMIVRKLIAKRKENKTMQEKG